MRQLNFKSLSCWLLEAILISEWEQSYSTSSVSSRLCLEVLKHSVSTGMSISETICLTELMLNSSPGSVWQSQLESRSYSGQSGSMQARQTYEGDWRQTKTSTWLKRTQLSQQVISSQKQLPRSQYTSEGPISQSREEHCSPMMSTLLRKRISTFPIIGYFFSPSSTPISPSPISSRNSTIALFILPLVIPVHRGWLLYGTMMSNSWFSTMSQIFCRYFWQSASSHSKMVLSSWKQKMVSCVCGSSLKSLILRSSSSRFSSKKRGYVNAVGKSQPEMGDSWHLSSLQRRFWRMGSLRSIQNIILEYRLQLVLPGTLFTYACRGRGFGGERGWVMRGV